MVWLLKEMCCKTYVLIYHGLMSPIDQLVTHSRVVLYARVSKAGDIQDPENQLQPLRLLAAAKGYVIVKEYVDRTSGSKDSRPALNALMTDATKGHVDFQAVMVWKFDRFARSTAHLLAALNTFTDNGIAFISLTESVDTSTAMGKMIFTILGAVAEMERALIIERVNAGLRRAAKLHAAGEPGHRSGRPLGATPSRATLWRRAKAAEAAGKV
jgi:DNA invertase Pin-like site-specific DNA recombinase